MPFKSRTMLAISFVFNIETKGNNYLEFTIGPVIPMRSIPFQDQFGSKINGVGEQSGEITPNFKSPPKVAIINVL